MKTGLHQHAALKQDLRINPRLYQAMDLLYMPLIDLQQHLKQELLGNPFLELLEPEEDEEAPRSTRPRPRRRRKGTTSPIGRTSCSTTAPRRSPAPATSPKRGSMSSRCRWRPRTSPTT